MQRRALQTRQLQPHSWLSQPSSIMRVPAAALAVLLLVAICSLAQADLSVSRSAGHPKDGRLSFPRREPQPH